MTLDHVPVGQTVAVQAVSGDDTLALRLESLGFRPGVHVEVVRRALLGDPTEYRLHGYRIGLRRDESSRVAVLEVNG